MELLFLVMSLISFCDFLLKLNLIYNRKLWSAMLCQYLADSLSLLGSLYLYRSLYLFLFLSFSVSLALSLKNNAITIHTAAPLVLCVQVSLPWWCCLQAWGNPCAISSQLICTPRGQSASPWLSRRLCHWWTTRYKGLTHLFTNSLTYALTQVLMYSLNTDTLYNATFYLTWCYKCNIGTIV